MQADERRAREAAESKARQEAQEAAKLREEAKQPKKSFGFGSTRWASPAATSAAPADSSGGRWEQRAATMSAAAASRATMHALVLGLSESDFVRLGEEPSPEAEAEQECFWQAEEQVEQ